MLEQLRKYALDHGLEPEPGFKPKDVRWAIVLSSSKGFLGIQELGDTSQKKNTGMTFKRCPDLGQRELISGGVTRSHFLVDTPNVVALYGDSAQDAKTQSKHKYFISLLTEAGKAMPEITGIAAFLQDPATLDAIRQRLEQEKVKTTEKVTFLLDDKFPLDSSDWHDWWRDFRKSITGEKTSTDTMRCLITGNLAVPLRTQPKIEKLADVGGQPSGDALISFDKEAFQSYGLEQSANAAVCEAAASAYRAGLNDLIKNHSQRLARAKVVHWFKEQVKNEDDPMAWLNGIEGVNEQVEISAQARAKKLLQGIKNGERGDLADNHYYALTLSGQAGRVMVRDWMEGDFKELAQNIDSWFADLSMVQNSGVLPTRDPKFISVLGSTVRELDNLTAPFVAKMWRVAIRSEPIPFFALAQSLARIRIAVIDKDKSPSYVGMGLLKAYHIRKNRKEGNTLAEMLKPGLNEAYPAPAYQCGRIMALLAEVQHAALGDVGAGIVQRYYAAASATPALVLGRLTRNSQFHLSKLDPGLSRWFDNQIAEVWKVISPQDLPATLTLEEQSLFALGYYQQLAAMRAGKSQNTNKENK